MSKKSGLGKFALGAAVGVGLGCLFAPKKGSETRAELKTKIDELVAKIQDVDAAEVKKEFDNKIKELKKELEDLDKEKALKLAKQKSAELKAKANELVDLAVAKGTPILRDAAEEVRLKTIEITEQVLEKLEKMEIK